MDLNRTSQPDAEAPLNLDHVRIDPSVARRLPESLARRRGVLPFGRSGEQVHVACLEPADAAALDAVERVFGCGVVAVLAEPRSLQRALQRVFQRTSAGPGDEFVTLVDELLAAAVFEQASDLHLDPERDGVRVRCRVDGDLQVLRTLATEQLAGVVNRIKVLAGMDIGERRLPQDGRFTCPVGDGPGIDVRVACLPTRFGERMTLRLLHAPEHTGTLAGLGLASSDLAALGQALACPHGLVLLTGPTGSGKTTTLYAGLRSLDRTTRNVLTVEDPVECELPGVAQIEVDSGDRITFARALRSLLRHDPDVLMIGEIRDLETAEVAVRASLTGHLVLSTLHTNSAAGVVDRLSDIGVPGYLIAASLRLAVAQRLVRRLCEACRRPRLATPSERAGLGLPDDSTVFDPVGCARCRGGGFVGRVALFELFTPDEATQRCLRSGAGTGLSDAGDGLRRDGARSVLAGRTTCAEVFAVVELR